MNAHKSCTLEIYLRKQNKQKTPQTQYFMMGPMNSGSYSRPLETRGHIKTHHQKK